MKPGDLLAERRGVVRDSAAGRVVPASQVWVAAPWTPARDWVEALNRSGRMPPGLRAEVRHLVLRAAARALERHPCFNDFLLLSGGVQQNPGVVVRVALVAEQRPAACFVPEAGRRPLEQVLAEIAAREVEEGVEGLRKGVRLARFRRTRPLLFRLASEGVLGPLFWARDRLPGLERRLRRNVRRTGTTSLRDLGALGASGAGGVLLACHVSGLLLAGPGWRLEPTSAGAPGLEPRPGLYLPLGLMFDARLFEAHEALAYLGEVAGALADPARSLA